MKSDGTPKRTMNAFILFSNDMRAKLADKNPHLYASPLSPELAFFRAPLHPTHGACEGGVAAPLRSPVLSPL
jgi:hypothetical protein